MNARPGGEPFNVTLRAGGNLIVSGSISDGFRTGGAATAATAANIRAAAVVLPGEAASIRLVGGADLTAASTLRTVAASGGDVRIGNGATLLVRSTTGDIDIAAARDVVLTDPGAVVYTTGRPTAALPAGYVGPTLANAYVRDGALRQALFLDGGGSIGVTAGGNVDFGGRASSQYGVDWWWRAARNDNVSWYSRYDRFQQGVAAFGGGDVTVRAGGDAINVSASAPDSGFLPSAADAATGAQARRYGGGSVVLEAAGDVIGSFVFAGGAQAQVRAGGSVRANGDGDALQVLAQGTVVSVAGRNGATVGKVAQAGLATPVVQFQADPPTLYLAGLATGATLDLHADAGDVVLTGLRPLTAPATAAQTSTEAGEAVLPDRVAIAAPNGSLSTATVVQLPAAGSSLSFAARDDATIGTLRVAGTTPAMSTPTTLSQLDVNALTLGVFDGGRAPFDTAPAREAVRLAARDGDLRLAGGIESARPLQASAGRDVLIDNPVTLQHQAGTELSSVIAGRDILLPTSFKASGFDLRVLGPGDLVVAAGRDIDFSQSGGIGASGNRDNRLLPAGSARLTVLAGVTLAGADGSAASLRFFPLLGGAGVADFAPDLAAQLEALKAGQAPPALGSPAASAYKARTVDEQLAQVKALAGDAAYDAAVSAFMRQRETTAPADAAAALAAFAKLGDAERAPLAGRLLAQLWSERVAPAVQREQALAMAATLGNASGAAALADFVAQRSGQRPADTAAALAAFDALPPGERLLFSVQQLAQALRASGRAASALSGAARDAAYARGYAALDAVFPAAAAAGSIRMGTSQVKTLQGGSVAVMAPRGAIDVGELVGGAKGASELGIVTADGGDIAVVAERDIAVNQSRVFTVGQGDLLMWSSLGNIDAGRGAKTVSGAPAPVFRLNAQGAVVVDTSGSFSGSGIAVLNDRSTLDLYAPRGEINAGDAGIQSAGNAFFGAVRFVGADNLAVGGVSVGAPPPVATGGATASLASLGPSATAAGNRPNPEDSEEEKERKRRRRLSLMLDFLGFGEAPAKP